MRYIIEHSGRVLEFDSFDSVRSFCWQKYREASHYEDGLALFWVDIMESAPFENSIEGMRRVLNRGESAFVELRSADGDVRDHFDIWSKFGYERERKVAEQEQLT